MKRKFPGRSGWRTESRAPITCFSSAPNFIWNKVRQKVPNDLGHGVCWEANLIYNALYMSKLNTHKFVPVVFTDSERQFIPTSA